jgi:hypothetical protein
MKLSNSSNRSDQLVAVLNNWGTLPGVLNELSWLVTTDGATHEAPCGNDHMLIFPHTEEQMGIVPSFSLSDVAAGNIRLSSRIQGTYSIPGNPKCYGFSTVLVYSPDVDMWSVEESVLN